MVGDFFGVAVAGEGEGGGLKVDFEGVVGDVRCADCQVDVISLWISG